MCDILWSDPSDENGIRQSKRGASIEFGPDISEKFLNDNDLCLLIRAHTYVEEGFEYQKGCERVLTVFSAPKYCGQMNNKGAYVVMKKDLIPNIIAFEAVEQPSTEVVNN